MKKIGLTLVLLAVLLSTGFAQRSEVGVMAGGMYYVGDLNPGKPFNMVKPAGGLLYRYNFDTRWALKADLLYGKVAGDDANNEYREDRNLNFTSSVLEFSMQMECNFLDFFIGSKRSWFSPYLFGGVSVFRYNPKATYNGDEYELQPLSTEGQSPYSLSSFAVPFGLGVKLSLSKRIGMGFEWGYRKTFTDYLDDVSGAYYVDFDKYATPSPAQLLSDPDKTHKPGMQRGDASNNDWYSFAGVHVTIRINANKKNTCEPY